MAISTNPEPAIYHNLYGTIIRALLACNTKQWLLITAVHSFVFVFGKYILFCSVLFCSVLFCSILFHSILFYFILFCSVLFCSVLFCSVLFCSVLLCSVLFCSVLFCSVLFCLNQCWFDGGPESTVNQHSPDFKQMTRFCQADIVWKTVVNLGLINIQWWYVVTTLLVTTLLVFSFICLYERWGPPWLRSNVLGHRPPCFEYRIMCLNSRDVLSEAVDCCIRFKINVFQHGGDLETQGPKNVHNFLMTVRKISWACDLVAEMLLILKKVFSTWLFETKS